MSRVNKFFEWFREKWDAMYLTDWEWKRKYCPNLYKYLFEMDDKERRKMWDNYIRQVTSGSQ